MEIKALYDIFLQHPVVTTDSRNCPEGSVFFALKGASFDGNLFADKALEKGCAYAVVDDASVVRDGRYLWVPDVLEALQELAAHHRRCWGRKIIQITGTNGKTTTKELLAKVLSTKYNVLFTAGNLNNHIGVPLTLLRLRPEHDMAVVETGASHPGEIALLSRLVQADYGLITNVGRGHLEGFGSFEGVIRTKGELYDYLREHGGTIFINSRDERLKEMAEQRGFTCACNTCAYVEAEVAACNPFLSIRWVEDGGNFWRVLQTHLTGSYNIANLRAAITVGLHFGVQADAIDGALASYKPTNGRSEYKKTERNELIVDAYNANPVSMTVALKSFFSVEAARKMAVLGEMRELGAASETEHRAILDLLLNSELERIWLVGDHFCAFRDAVSDARFSFFPSILEVRATLERHPLSGYTILIKGSNGTRLHELPEAL